MGGSNSTVLLSTAPWCPGTHWYQIRFLLETPLALNAGQHIEGTLKMEANNLQSYYVKLFMQIKGTNISSEAPCIDLKDPEYRFYTSANAYCPPGTAGVWGQQNSQQTSNGNGTTQTQTYQQAHFQQTQQVPPSSGLQQQTTNGQLGGQFQGDAQNGQPHAHSQCEMQGFGEHWSSPAEQQAYSGFAQAQRPTNPPSQGMNGVGAQPLSPSAQVPNGYPVSQGPGVDFQGKGDGCQPAANGGSMKHRKKLRSP